MAAYVRLALPLFLDVVQPVLLVEEKLAAFHAFYDVVFVGFMRVLHELFIAWKPGVAVFALVLFTM